MEQEQLWTINDIMSYYQCGRAKALKIRNIAIQNYNGFSIVFPKKVFRDSVIKAVESERRKRNGNC